MVEQVTNGAGERQPLALSPGQRQPLLADPSVESPRQLGDESGLRDCERFLDLVVVGVGLAHEQVLADRR